MADAKLHGFHKFVNFVAPPILSRPGIATEVRITRTFDRP